METSKIDCYLCDLNVFPTDNQMVVTDTESEREIVISFGFERPDGVAVKICGICLVSILGQVSGMLMKQPKTKETARTHDAASEPLPEGALKNHCEEFLCRS